MEILNFDECKRPDVTKQRHYGGLSGIKEHVLIDNENYFLKYPDNLEDKKNYMTNVILSYTSAPVSEYLGSRIYEILNVPVHETILGISKKYNHVVVACKDFLNKGDKLDEFREIKVSIMHSDSHISCTSGNGANLEETINVINTNEFFRNIAGVEKRFWQMFVIDAFIGNSDRNNGNWGVIRRYDDTNVLAPVYDNGASFNNKWDDEKIKSCLSDQNLLTAESYRGKTCFFTKREKGQETKLNPFKVMNSLEYPALSDVMKELVPDIYKSQVKIFNLIDEIPDEKDGIRIISGVQKKFYKSLLTVRYQNALLPVLNKINGKGEGIEFNVLKQVEKERRK